MFIYIYYISQLKFERFLNKFLIKLLNNYVYNFYFIF